MNKELNIQFLKSKVRIILLVIFLIVAGSLVTIDFLGAIHDDAYFVAHEDEVIYYGAAQVFAETGSLQAESCIEENVSQIGQFNWYGPGYNAIYGTLQKVFTQTNTLFIKAHFCAAILILLVIVLMPQLTTEDKLLLICILLTTEQFTCYIFSYFPEIIHLFFSIILAFLLVKIYETGESGDVTKLIFFYVTLIIIFSSSRITTVFWLAGLLPLKSTWRNNIPYIITFIIGVTLSVIYLRYFIAPPYAGEMHKLQHLYHFNIADFLGETIGAGFKNFIRVFRGGSIPVYLLLLLIGVLAYLYFKTKDKFLLAVMFICACLMGVLMAYYTVDPFFFVKQTAMLLPLLLVAVMRSASTQIKWMLLVVFSCFITKVQSKRFATIQEHQAAFVNLQNNKSLQAAFQSIRERIAPNTSHVILWCYNEFDYGSAAQALLPYSTLGGLPIMYTTNIVFDHQNTSLTEKFKLHGKLPVDYILSRSRLEWLTPYIIHETPYFYFYRITP